MTLITCLIALPIMAGAVLLLLPVGARKFFVSIVAACVCAGSIGLIFAPHGGAGAGSWFSSRSGEIALLASEAAIALFILWVAICRRSFVLIGITIAQVATLGWMETLPKHHEAAVFYLDSFSVIMALINGVIGAGICLYALGYMREFHAAHPEVKDRQPLFFGVLLLFVGAMFGIILSNSLAWLLLFWEITTLCSFLLIGYTGTSEAHQNALRALTLNSVGGLAFAVAIGWSAKTAGIMELQTMLSAKSAAMLAPAGLLCLAGMTKSAQLPFSGWLLGAMVAPTPVSALLHSSAMVKAGVYLVLRMAPVVAGTGVGFTVAVLGATTFLVGSFAAITTGNAKRVLAWSTIANLGLVVLCGGIGTNAAVWAGVLLIIFHAISKCLLFLCVGAVEHKLHSREIEDMSGLILSMPKLAIMMLLGMAGMFLAPFGMLISKWAVLKAVVDASPAIAVFIVFGSAATLFFWVKWMGKLLEAVRPQQRVEHEFGSGEAVPLYGLSVATFLTCLSFPFISSLLIEPYVKGVYGQSASLAPGNVVIMMIMLVMIMLFPLSFINYGRGVKVMEAYLGGANLQSSTRFLGSGARAQQVTMSNYYLKSCFNEQWLTRAGIYAGSALVALLVGLTVL